MGKKYLEMFPQYLIEEKDIDKIIAFIVMLPIHECIKKYILKEVCDELQLDCKKEHYMRVSPSCYQIR